MCFTDYGKPNGPFDGSKGEDVRDAIWRWSTKTPKGNTLQFFYNRNNNLVVVDLIHASGEGGNELCRVYMEEDKMLGHVEK